MTMNPLFDSLSPAAVWRHFSALCAIPHPSKHEAALVNHLRDWAANQGLRTHTDKAGNLILEKPAAPGRESAPGIVLQGHLDMVCQKTSDAAHDFFRDPITPVREEDWLLTPKTTLGADNGIGVALALAALEARDLRHGPLEVLLTVDEEAGMGGACALEPGILAGRYLLNLDTEEWGQFYLGCAGGVEVEARLPVAASAAPAGWQGLALQIDGLLGGHSGIDIHLPRAHAIRLLVSVLLELGARHDFALASLAGGTAINALPRSAAAVLALPSGNLVAFENAVEETHARLRQAWPAEPGLSLTWTRRSPPEQALAAPEWSRLLRALLETPYGVIAMSEDFPGVVETSNNLSPLSLSPSGCQANFLVRSLKDGARDALAARIVRAIEKAGGQASVFGDYPGWEPRPDSPLLARCQAIYQATFGQTPGLQVIHAGLECGLFARSHPQLEMLSFGPDIRGAHAPGERVHIASVARCWQFLTCLLEQL
jgi:dipeptidase D